MASTRASGAASAAKAQSQYKAQRAYVAGMMRLLSGLLEAASETDPVVREEVANLPEGLVIGMSVLGDSSRMRIKKRGGVLVRLDPDTNQKPELEIVFKHVTHAFLVLSFQEGTARAFANDRMITQGDLSLAMKVVRCLNRVEAVVLPRFVAERALKAYPELGLGEKLSAGARIYGRTLAHVLGGK
ncbi:MAG: hypothetical protein U0230_18170 [Polyangiales bacterium]